MVTEKITIVSELQPPQNNKERKTRERIACFLKHPKEEKFALIEEKMELPFLDDELKKMKLWKRELKGRLEKKSDICILKQSKI